MKIVTGAPQILIIEDDPTFSTLTRDLLTKEYYGVKTVSNGRDGWLILKQEDFNLVILDLGLPDLDGLDLCAQIKKASFRKEVPVFILTGRGSSEDIVKGLEAGADDYLAKPFNEREFMARVQAILRRWVPKVAQENEMVSGKVKLSPSYHEAWVEDRPIPLTLREFDILKVFLSYPGKAQSREDIIRSAWGPATSIVSKVVDVHVGHLRHKLGAEGKRIETVPQIGYKWVTPEIKIPI